MIKVLLSLVLFVLFSYTSYRTVEPVLLPIEQVDKILFSYLALPFIAVWGLCIFGGVSLFVSFNCFINKQDYKGSMRTLYLSMFVGAIIGLSVNYANFYLVIKPHNMVECPEKAGYKKNLMRDYVMDLSLCEKL